MITDLRLQNFRSYKDTSFEVDPGVNIIVGPNASGKTNLLEAVLVLARGGSYRAKDMDLVRHNQPWARLDAHLAEGGERTVKIVCEPSPSKALEVLGKTYRRIGLAQTLPAILFEPNHLLLLSGGPERRRDYLDDLLEQTVSGHGSLSRQYKRTLAQRNSLLKQPNTSTDQLFPWDVRLSELAGQIVRARTQLVENLNSRLPKLYKALSGGKVKVSISYLSPWPADQYESRLLKKLEADHELDRLRGFTGSGPHREDFALHFDEKLASEAASRGEARTAILALKILELELIEAERNQKPILLLDDVFSELDGKRRHALTDYLAPYQTFITTTDADLVVKNFTQKCKVIPLS
ncbi:MAG TPA: DNA replication/repair protein RecF [Candidatus Saccharimonadales bacterium]|nr:DNA replication/repair protein RecF [Candidatus Saccharimonadales bacterium]